MLYNMMAPFALAIGKLDAETLTLAWQTPLLGMGMVFAVLATLWGVLSIFKLVFAGKTPKAKKEAPAPKVTEVPKAAQTVEAPKANEDDLALIAILTAAVAAYRAEEGEADGGFRVVSFKRTGNVRAWNAKK